MIELTNLNGKKFIINSNLIVTINSIPESKITLNDGTYYLVLESKEEIVKKVIAYNRKIFTNLLRIE